MKSSAFLDSDESDGEAEADDSLNQVESAGTGEGTALMVGSGGRKFLGDSDDEEGDTRPEDKGLEAAGGESRAEKRGRSSPDSAGESDEETSVKKLRGKYWWCVEG